MSRLGFPWLVTLLAVPAGAALLGSSFIDAERLRRATLAAACLTLILALALIAILPATGAMTDPWDPSGLFLDAPLLRVNALSSLLLPFTALLWILAVGVTPRQSLDRDGLRRTALSTLTT